MNKKNWPVLSAHREIFSTVEARKKRHKKTFRLIQECSRFAFSPDLTVSIPKTNLSPKSAQKPPFIWPARDFMENEGQKRGRCFLIGYGQTSTFQAVPKPLFGQGRAKLAKELLLTSCK